MWKRYQLVSPSSGEINSPKRLSDSIIARASSRPVKLLTNASSK
ncbi:Uncharacterised protein [Vibrio cholerae]|nr:Uncharacterised protein [Vibrio cholerae]CSH99626.1 Uncharacterised protein [Vibrio cholerae]